ncbi:MAG: ABC transporter ATP-binding protein [Dorea sp.]|nr:ABC transporter ATP-binding protein [Dorea sp.]MCI9248088.1 ABC transporter ATP-binding protein [Dorea sp.]
MELIRTENVVKNYGSTEVLKGVSLNIREREFVGIMGKSGSGKTTLLKILGMTEPVTDGELMYRGKRAQELSDKESARIRREELGFVFQEFFLMDSLDILENVMLPLLISKDADGRGKKKAAMLMERFGIRELAEKMPCELSGGERQRTAICRALINDPQLVLADEPTGSLDSKSGKTVIDSLGKINRELGKTIIMVTHDPWMASHCSRVVLLKDGIILDELKCRNVMDTFYQEILGRMSEL